MKKELPERKRICQSEGEVARMKEEQWPSLKMFKIHDYTLHVLETSLTIRYDEHKLNYKHISKNFNRGNF